MVGGAEIQSEESFVDTKVIFVQLLTIFFTFPIFHTIKQIAHMMIGINIVPSK